MKRADRNALQYMRDMLARRPIYVFTDLSGKRRIGRVIKINNWTTWVKILIGAKAAIVIKRNNKKHHLTPYQLGRYYEEVPQSPDSAHYKGT